MISDVFEQKVARHYAPGSLLDTIFKALAAAGKDPDHLTLEDLAPLDEFHLRGREATAEMAEKLNLTPAEIVLDVGSGLGGPSRYLAVTYGSRVTGLDLTAAFCQAAEMLAQRLGLSDQVSYHQGSALRMPFEDGAFDVVWTQHAAMNIADKQRLYSEIWRVLRPGGRLALNDILQGPGGEVIFPVPWARTPDLSFLSTPEELRGLLETQGFEIESWRDTTEPGRAAFNQIVERMTQADSRPMLGFQVFLGADSREIAVNVARNLDEGRIVAHEVIARKGSPAGG